jgi:hypothetical protein
MSKTLGNNAQRATRGLGLAATVGMIGAAVTAAGLIALGGATPDGPVPFQVTEPAVLAPTPEPQGEIGTAVSIGPHGELGGGVSRNAKKSRR